VRILISGGLGDSINQVGKLLFYCKENNIKHDTVELTYCNDTHDNDITTTNLAANTNAITDMHYYEFVADLARIHGFQFKKIVADQKEESASGNYDVVLGPNMDYELKIWEDFRQLHIGHRPNETRVIPSETIDWKYDEITDVDIVVHVRFAEENPTKEKISFQNEVELLKLLKDLDYKKHSIHLIGRTKHDMSKFSNIVTVHMDKCFEDQYNVLLSSKLFNITNPGFSCNLSVAAGKMTYRKYWDDAERTLQINPCYMKHCIEFNHFSELKKLIGEK